MSMPGPVPAVWPEVADCRAMVAAACADWAAVAVVAAAAAAAVAAAVVEAEPNVVAAAEAPFSKSPMTAV